MRVISSRMNKIIILMDWGGVCVVVVVVGVDVQR